MPGLKKLAAMMLTSLIFVLQLAGCTPNPLPTEYNTYTNKYLVMDTVVEVRIDTKKSEAEVTEIFANLSRELIRLDNLLSAFAPSSDVARINQQAGNNKPVQVSPETLAVVNKALALAGATGGAFDITLAPVIQLYNFAKKEHPDSSTLIATLKLVDYTKVDVDVVNSTVFLRQRDMSLDLGGIAKGYVVDRAMDMLIDSGVEYAAINAGGDIKFSGPKPDGSPWLIGVSEPDFPREKFFARVYLDMGAIVTSGDYERFFMDEDRRYHHIIDPASGLPADQLRSVTIIGPDGLSSDLLSTAVFVMGTQAGLALINEMEGYEAILYDSDNKIHLSNGLESEAAQNSKGESLYRFDGTPILDIKIKGR